MQLWLSLGHNARMSARSAAHITCVYCGESAATRDHVPPKAVLTKPYPANLRTVPACTPCNRSWSLDEKYLAIVLAYITDNPRLQAALDPDGKIGRALSASSALNERINASLIAEANGRVSFVPEMGRIGRIAAKMAFGLYCLRYGTGCSPNAFSVVGIWGPGEQPAPAVAAAQWQWPGIRRKRWTVVQKDIFGFMFAKG